MPAVAPATTVATVTTVTTVATVATTGGCKLLQSACQRVYLAAHRLKLP